MAHAKRSPSSASRWSVCTMSVVEEAGKVDTSGDAARWGTANHLLSSTCLTEHTSPAQYLGLEVDLDTDKIIDPIFEDAANTLPIDAEQVACATAYVNRVREIHASVGGTLLVEQRMPIGHITGEEGAGGTGDVVILAAPLMIAIDLKTGRVKVNAKTYDGRMNLQLGMYLDGSRVANPGEYTTFTGMIIQPTIDHESEHTVDAETLAAEIQVLSDSCVSDPVHAVTDETCKYCKAFPCSAASDVVITASGFDNLEDEVSLGHHYGLIPLVEKWVKKIEERVRADLDRGVEVPGWKMVEGRLGKRQWKDAAVAEGLMVKFRLGADAYDRTVISPTTAEKLVGPRQWKTLQEQIEQHRNKPSIVRSSDAREPVPSFDNLDLM